MKNEVSEDDSPNKKNRINYWIKQIDIDERNTTSYGNIYIIYKYRILDKKLKDSEIVFNKWKIRRIYDPPGKNAYNYAKSEYIDPTNEIRTTQINSIEQALRYLDDYCEYNNWQMYDLSVSNKKLSEENERLKEDNGNLYILLDSFINTRLYKKMSRKAERINLSKARLKENHKIFNKEFSVNSNFIRQWFKKYCDKADLIPVYFNKTE